MLRPGDLVVLDGRSGAGKTALAQGIGAGLGVVGAGHLAHLRHRPGTPARPGPGGRLPLVHVDAYRLGAVPDPAEIDDLDLDAALEDR